MPATIKIKNSSTTGAVPTSGDLVQGELAVNVTDTGLYTENASGTVVKLNAPSIDDKNTGATKHLTISTAGNLGLGVTPSAWGTSAKAIEVGSGASTSLAFNFSETNLSTNVYRINTGASLYKANGIAMMYTQSSGGHSWYNAASGTAGNAITFTQAMTLDASGNLGVGYTAPTQTFTAGINTGVKGYNIVYTVNGSEVACWTANASTGEIKFGAGSTYFPTFWSNGSERARIDSSGNLLVGTTSGTSRLTVYTSTAGATVCDIQNTAASGNPVILYPRMTVAGTTSNYFFAGQANGSDKIYIYGNGNIVNSNNSYGSLSDVKLKENITDSTPKLSSLMQVRVVNYNLKSEPEKKQLGVIAQEVEQIFPAMIDESPDRDADGNELGTTTKSVKYSVFVPMLIKAIQEQQAIITQLQADVAALKGQA